MPDKTFAQLARLGKITNLLRDTALSRLAASSAACMETSQKIRDLDAPLPSNTDLPQHFLVQAAILHQRWAEPKKMALNQLLARQMAERMRVEAQARQEVGRAEIIAKLHEQRRNALK